MIPAATAGARKPRIELVRGDAETFLLALTGSPDVEVTFQTFDDGRRNGKSRALARVLHGTLSTHWRELAGLNAAGAGVFVMVNEGDGQGRAEKNVRALRALFIDDDTGELEPAALELAPSIIVKSKNGLHAYWRLRPGETLGRFESAQAALAAKLGTDPTVKDLPRVMRVPGFLHRKGPDPFLVEVVQTSGVTYSIAEVLEAFGVSPQTEKPSARRNGFAAPTGSGIFERARRYLEKVPPAIEGEHGDDATYRIAAVLVVDFNLSDDDAFTLLQEWNRTCSPPWSDAELGKFIEHARKYGKHPPGAKSAEQPPNGASNGATGHQRQAAEWDPPIMFDETARLPDFPLESLSLWHRAFVEGIAAQVQVPPDMVAVLTLAALGAACAKRVRVEDGGGHSEPVNLYVLAVMEPGERKSEVFRLVTEPIRRLEQEEVDRRRPFVVEKRIERDFKKARINKLKEKAAKKKDGDALEEAKQLAEELASDPEPTLPRWIADDATQEVLARLLSENGERLALFAAEGNIFGIAGGRYAKNKAPPNLSVFLNGWSGDPLRVDRMERELDLKQPLLTIGMTVQRQVLREMAEIEGATGKGLPTRFLYALPQTRIGTRSCTGTQAPARVVAEYEKRLSNLLQGLANTGERILRLSPPAAKVQEEFFDRIEAECRDGERLASPSLRAYASKLQGQALRLMGGLHMAAYGPSAPDEITAASAEAAVALADYFLAHGRAALDEMGVDPVIDFARRAVEWIVREKRPVLTRRDLQRALNVKRATQLDPVLLELEARSVICPVPAPEIASARRGRPPGRSYFVNPRCLR